MAYIEKRGDSYKIRVSCGYDTSGKQVRQSLTWTPSPKMTAKQIAEELQRQKVLFEQKCLHGQVTAPVKFQNYATEYLENVAPLALREGTLANYKNYTKRVYKTIGHLRMDKIKSQHIQSFINEMSTGKRLDRYREGRKLSAKTVRNHIAFISSVYEYAIKMQVISFNPCRAVILPADNAKEVEIYSVEETLIIIDLLCKEDRKNLHYTVYFLLAVYTGFRRGELLGLEFKDIDFDRQTITLNRTSLYTKGKGVYTGALKTRTSYRTLKLPPEIMEILKQYKAHRDEYRENLGDVWVEQIKGLNDEMVDNDRLFTQWDGKPMFTNSPSLFFGRFCKRHGIVYRKGHSLRHLNASVQIFAGVDVKAIQSNLGHSQASTTLNIYGKVFQAAQAASLDKIVGILGVPSLQAV